MAYRNSKVVFVVFTILAVIGIYGEEQSGGSESGSSVEDDGVTITNCFFRDSESSSSDDDDTNRQCMTAYILRDSGNITLRDNRLEAANGFLMSLELMSLREVSPCGEILAAGHSYSGFSEQGFYFSDIQHGTYRDIAVKFVSFNATLSNSANVKIHVYLIDGYGIINNGDEAIAVMPGVAKISIQITKWPFCGEGDVTCEYCSLDDGKYLDLELAVKGTSAAAQEYRGENNGLWFRVGLGNIIFSQKVQLDESDTVSSMIPGYPTHNRQNEKDIFYLRFPKFASYLVYDPYGCLTCDIEVKLDESDTVSSMIPGYPTHRRHNGKDIFCLRFPKFASKLEYDPNACYICGIGTGR